jgi:hypothetical protein
MQFRPTPAAANRRWAGARARIALVERCRRVLKPVRPWRPDATTPAERIAWPDDFGPHFLVFVEARIALVERCRRSSGADQSNSSSTSTNTRK